MLSLFRTHKLPWLLAVLLSLTLLTSSVLAAHVHNDGLPHYSDCDTCLQLSGLDAVTQSATPTTAPFLAVPSFSDCSYTRASIAHNAFQARAPPSFLS